MVDYNELIKAIADLDENTVVSITDEVIADGAERSALEQTILSLQKGMEEVGRLFEAGEYFLVELMFVAEIVKDSLYKIKPFLGGTGHNYIGKVVIGTVQGDLHDIGKNIVGDMLTAAGFEVLDLGVSVPVEEFIKEIKEHQPQIVGLSCLLTQAIETMKMTVEGIEDAGLRDKVKIIIGGNPVSEQVCAIVGADAYAKSAVKGIEECKRMVI